MLGRAMNDRIPDSDLAEALDGADANIDDIEAMLDETYCELVAEEFNWACFVPEELAVCETAGEGSDACVEQRNNIAGSSIMPATAAGSRSRCPASRQSTMRRAM